MEELRNSPNAASAPQSRWRTHGWVGLLLIATCWPLNWTLKGLTAYLFFPLWLGYVLAVAWPKCCYPFVWTSLVLILEPLNRWLGREHFMEYLERGDWRPIVSLSVGVLICGFFWEMWNYYSWPKWIYHTPGAQFLHVFEMPLLGYGGYVPFALELFVLRNLLWRGAPRVTSRGDVDTDRLKDRRP